MQLPGQSCLSLLAELFSASGFVTGALPVADTDAEPFSASGFAPGASPVADTDADADPDLTLSI